MDSSSSEADDIVKAVVLTVEYSVNEDCEQERWSDQLRGKIRCIDRGLSSWVSEYLI